MAATADHRSGGGGGGGGGGDPPTLTTSALFLSALSSNAVTATPLPLSHSLLSQGAALLPVPASLPDPNLIPNSRFIVDGFRHAGDFSVAYFLSHFHSDHYAGLGPSWCSGVVYCSDVTARLVREVLKVPDSLVRALDLGRVYEIDGWEVVLVDANHCPGAVQFLFRSLGSPGSKQERYVHTGDFRFCPSMKEDANLVQFVGADAVFLDTTYCNPRFCFSSQEESIEYIVRTIRRIRDGNREAKEKILFLIATYVIGKEKILLEVATKCNCLLHVDSRKMQILSILGFGGSGFFTEDLGATDVCVVGWNVLGETWPYFRPNFASMQEIMAERGYDKAVGFVATGWMYETKKEGFAVRVKDPCEIHLVPYSEHSSYSELKEYVRFLRPKRVIPTVGEDIDKSSSKGTIALRRHFSGLVDEMANKHDFLLPFHQKLELDVVCDKALEDGTRELRNLLPDWVTDEQILSLLKASSGDTVEAVSEFFERERDFYEEANSCSSNAVTNSQETSLIDLDFSASSKAKVEGSIFPPKKFVSPIAKFSTPSTPKRSPNVPKKRASSSKAAKPRKKGKSVAPPQTPSGGKQSTITAIFGRFSALVKNPSTTGGVLDQNKEDRIENPETNLDRLLQIIGDGMTRESAESLLDKAQGDINLAVEMFYSQKQCMTDKISVKEVSTLNVKAFVQAETEFGNVSLPIEQYDPITHACWKAGEPAPYLHLARTLNLVEQEKGKIKTTAMFCNMFRSLLALSPEDVLPAVYLCTNRIAPEHENMELNIGGSLVVSSLEESLGTSKARIKDLYNAYGDLGDAAQECRQSQSLLAPPRPLSIRGVFHMLRKISSISGGGSSGRRKILVISLLNSCREMEIKYLVRTLVRNLRVGAMMRTILPALANAVVLNSCSVTEKAVNPETLKEQIQVIASEVTKAYNVLPNLDLLVPSLLSKGSRFLAAELAMVPGTPIPPMLARITNGFSQALKLFHGRAFTCEYKYDGQRAQIHKLGDGSVRIFSRQMKESTSRFPDLVNAIRENCNPAVQTFILDAEVVAIDRKSGKIMSFQELSSRERGSKDTSILLHNIKVEVCVFLFDVMLHDGKRLLECPLRERRKYLHDLVQEKPGYLQLATETTVEGDQAYDSNEHTVSKMRSFFEQACNSSCEGIMIKSLDADATYSASNRSESWLKVKRDYVEGLGDSLDLVPIGAWYGNGRKAGWYSPFLMACYNPEAEEFQSVCRVMSGFSDAFYKEMKEYFSEEKILSKKLHYYQTDESPDFWFVPELVWEIRGADLTISPVHHAAVGLVHPSRGISVRLPRFVRSLSDRNAEDCSTAADIASMFKSQTRKMGISLEEQ